MDGGAWWATVHGVVKSWTQLSDFTHFGVFDKTSSWLSQISYAKPKISWLA